MKEALLPLGAVPLHKLGRITSSALISAPPARVLPAYANVVLLLLATDPSGIPRDLLHAYV